MGRFGERVRIFAFNQIGELLGPAVRGGDRNPFGRSGRPEIKSKPYDLISKPQAEKDRDWQARTINHHWVAVEPIVEAMKRYVLKRRGELLPPPVRGNPRPETGRGSTSLASEVESKSKQQRQLDWQAQTNIAKS